MKRPFQDSVTELLWTIPALGLTLALSATAAFAQHEGKSADEVAKELSNPAGALASLVNNIEYTRYKGDLPGADEIWLTSSTREISPVTRLDDRSIGDGTPGPLWRRMIGIYRDYTNAVREGRAA